jgi:hypothetical protein
MIRTGVSGSRRWGSTDYLDEGIGACIRHDVEATGRARCVVGTVGRSEGGSHPVGVVD